MSHTGIETDVPAVRQGGATNAAIVAAVEIGGAALLGAFLLSDKTAIIVALLAVMGAIFAVLQLRPRVEERIVAAFRDQRRLSMALGTVIVLTYPFFMNGSSYVLHLTAAGRAIFDETMPLMVKHQAAMLGCLSEDEQQQLCALMDKLVIASPAWPQEL